MNNGKNLRKILFRVLQILFSVALMMLLTASLILAKPQEDKTDKPAATASSEAVPAVTIEQETDIPQLMTTFPAHLMSFLSGSGMDFVSASAYDVVIPGGFGRVVDQSWLTAEGEPVTIRSIWPATALNLLEDGFHFMPYGGPSLFGNASPSVRMENDSMIRLHASTDEALYVVLLPRSLSGQVSSICSSLQLYYTGGSKAEDEDNNQNNQ